MRKHSVLTLLCLAILCYQPVDAFAYLDPGTGSMLLSVIVGVVSSAYFFIRRLPSLIRSTFFKFSGNKDDLKNNSIVFYAESKTYWSTFKPVLEVLAQKNQKVTYLTSDENDPVFNSGLDEWVHAKFIGKGQTAYTALGFLEAKVFALTTPGIDVLQIRRSPGVKKYVHILHAIGDIHYYKLYSFDYYDIVFCSSPAQQKSLRVLEQHRKTSTKELPLLGCPYLDLFFTRKQNEDCSPEPNTILVAPTWGKNSLLQKEGGRLIATMLAKQGYHVIFRPHPQSLVSEAEMIQQLKETYKQYSNIEWDTNSDGFPSLQRAQLMISDISSVIFDFAFVFLKPVISIGHGPVKEGFEAWHIPHAAWEMEILNDLGRHLQDVNEVEIVSTVPTLIQNSNNIASKISDIRDKHVVNFGHASELIASELINIANSVKENN